jgi:hypothetical protein
MSRQFFITVPAATVGVRPYTIDPESADRSEALTRLKSNYCGSCLASEHLLELQIRQRSRGVGVCREWTPGKGSVMLLIFSLAAFVYTQH